jgi:cysteine desulfuration protein SufE
MLTVDPQAALAPFDLEGHLTPQRSNGLHSMIKRIREIASCEAA